MNSPVFPLNQGDFSIAVRIAIGIKYKITILMIWLIIGEKSILNYRFRHITLCISGAILPRPAECLVGLVFHEFYILSHSFLFL
jgi:hypothetical protein